jgi:mannose-6-phosphate isomerase-like protein (cupin superfamily)
MARQVFTILSGTAAMILDGERVALAAGDSLTVPAGALHQFLNDGEVAVRFLVISYPRAKWDRIDQTAAAQP